MRDRTLPKSPPPVMAQPALLAGLPAVQIPQRQRSSRQSPLLRTDSPAASPATASAVAAAAAALTSPTRFPRESTQQPAAGKAQPPAPATRSRPALALSKPVAGAVRTTAAAAAAAMTSPVSAAVTPATTRSRPATILIPTVAATDGPPEKLPAAATCSPTLAEEEELRREVRRSRAMQQRRRARPHAESSSSGDEDAAGDDDDELGNPEDDDHDDVAGGAGGLDELSGSGRGADGLGFLDSLLCRAVAAAAREEEGRGNGSGGERDGDDEDDEDDEELNGIAGELMALGRGTPLHAGAAGPGQRGGASGGSGGAPRPACASGGPHPCYRIPKLPMIRWVRWVCSVPLTEGLFPMMPSLFVPPELISPGLLLLNFSPFARSVPHTPSRLAAPRFGRRWYRGNVLQENDGPTAEVAAAAEATAAGLDSVVAAAAVASGRVQLECPGMTDAADGPGLIWMARDSDRLWRGSYKNRDWKYLVRAEDAP